MRRARQGKRAGNARQSDRPEGILSGPGHPQRRWRRTVVSIGALAAALLAVAGVFWGMASEIAPASPETLPPDGEALYAALLEQIPEVVAEVPCSCCGESLKWCYEGGCPPD